MSLRSVDLPAPLGPTAHGEAATGRCTKMKVDFIVDDDVSGPSTQNVLDDPGVVDYKHESDFQYQYEEP
jgi:hypothetical protein